MYTCIHIYKTKKGAGNDFTAHALSQASRGALPDHTLYCSAKGALDMLTKVLVLDHSSTLSFQKAHARTVLH